MFQRNELVYVNNTYWIDPAKQPFDLPCEGVVFEEMTRSEVIQGYKKQGIKIPDLVMKFGDEWWYWVRIRGCFALIPEGMLESRCDTSETASTGRNSCEA